MPGKTSIRVGEVGSGAKIVHLPVAWTRAVGLVKGTEVEFFFDDVGVILPNPTSPQARRVLAALREKGEA
ncbi:MAG: hypothetical protein ACLPP2_07780 [Thermoplasmata archaeon]